MRKELGKRIRERFTKQLNQVLPQFKPTKDPFAIGGDRMYAWACGEKLTFFIYLQPSQKWDGFYVELAWSGDNKWPGRLVPGRPAEPGEGEGFRERLEYIIDKKARRSSGWDVVPKPALDNPLGYIYLPSVESAFDRADELVDFVVGHIAEEGLAFFRQVAADRGCELPS